MILPYESEKWLGFYFSNVSISFDMNAKSEPLLKTEYKTGVYKKEMRPGLKTDNLVATPVEIIDQFWYHPFYPVYLKNIESQETDMKLDAVVPAFMLKANQDKQFWSNVMTSAEYALDVVTTLSGIGNIAKFRYLAKFATKAGKLRFVSKAGRKVVEARKVVAATAAVVEITSGTVNVLLKLTGARDTEWGKSLSEYLFWLELLSLSGELTVAIHNGLRKSAKEVLEHEDELRKSAKNAEEAKQIDEVIEELERVANKEDDLFRKIEELFDLSGGKLLTKKELDLLKDFLWQRYNVRLKLVDVDHSLKNKLLDWNDRNVLGSFRQGPPPELYLRANNASELTVFHEMVHLKYWFEGKPKIHFAQEEIVVWEEIWKTKAKWTNQELLDSYYYVEKLLRDTKLNSDLEKLIGNYRPDIQQIIINKNLGIK